MVRLDSWSDHFYKILHQMVDYFHKYLAVDELPYAKEKINAILQTNERSMLILFEYISKLALRGW